MLNEHIYKQPLVMFLGAGASAPLGMKTTVQFIEWVKTHRKTDSKLIIQVLKNVKASKEIGQKKDIEAVLDCLESIIEASGLYKKLDLFAKTDRFFGKLNKIDTLRKHIQDLVVEHYSEIDIAKACNYYIPLFEGSGTRCLPVFTTNYDLSIEKCYEDPSVQFQLVDGFRKERRTIPHWAGEVYKDYVPKENSNDVVLFKLHGSVDWVKTPDGAIQRTEAKKRDPAPLKSVLVYPSRTKKEIHEEPFRTNYDYLLACLAHAQKCVVVGFSFRDQEIVEHFREACGTNKKLQVVVFDTNRKFEDHIIGKFTPSRGLKVIQVPRTSAEMTIEYVARHMEQEIPNQESRG